MQKVKRVKIRITYKDVVIHSMIELTVDNCEWTKFSNHEITLHPVGNPNEDQDIKVRIPTDCVIACHHVMEEDYVPVAGRIRRRIVNEAYAKDLKSK